MKIPAIRAKIGDWTYYVSTLSFEQVNQFVEKIDDQLHKAELLRDLIQRSITKNYISIKEYIINQPEMFFNSLVLGVYDGMPKWIEVELNYNGEEFFNLGFLDFPGDQKIFPIDGQHRVEGIKAAILEDPKIKDNKISVIFVGHSKSEDGMKRSRRLFTTLNRYAKPVTMDDTIALDEDDSIAIVTRNLIESYPLFKEKRITKSPNKAISDKDKTSLTSLITLYQCNRELLKLFRLKLKSEAPNTERDRKSLETYLKFRPKETDIQLFEAFVKNFWDSFSSNIADVTNFLNLKSEAPATEFRNKENGGSLIFRPVGLLPLVQASIEIKKRTGLSFNDIFKEINKINFTLEEIPWKFVLWNPNEKTMIMGTQGLVKMLIMYQYNSSILRASEIRALEQKYADKTSWEGDDSDKVLETIKTIKPIQNN